MNPKQTREQQNIYTMLQSKAYIFFDVGFTLIDETRCYHDYIKQCVQELAKENIIVTESDYHNMMIDAARKRLKPLRTVWDAFTNNPRPKWNPESEIIYEHTRSTLEVLSKHFKLGIIANQIEGLEERLINHGIYTYFEVIASSHEDGYKKPDLRIFQEALQKAHTSADQCIYVGDRPDNDIIPAKKLGFTTIRIMNGFGQYQPEHPRYASDYYIFNISEILEIIGINVKTDKPDLFVY